MNGPLSQGKDIIKYEDGLNYIRDYFKSFGKGERKTWAEAHNINPQALLNVLGKTSSTRALPNTARQILEAMGFQVEIIKETYLYVREVSKNSANDK